MKNSSQVHTGARLIYQFASGSVGRAGTPCTETVTSATGSNPPVASAPDQGTRIRFGVTT